MKWKEKEELYMSVCVKVWGDLACFTRPEYRSERVSYDVMTPTAAIGILRQIYWHPGVEWVIDRIYVRKPIQFISIRRNELQNLTDWLGKNMLSDNMYSRLKSVTSDDDFLEFLQSPISLPYVDIMSHTDTKSVRTQRNNLLLKDVCYIICAHFELSCSGMNPNKVQASFMKRLLKGKCVQQPYLGCEEFTADFEHCDKIPPCPEELCGTYDLGYMLGGLDYRKESPLPLFFHAVMKDGRIDVPREVRIW